MFERFSPLVVALAAVVLLSACRTAEHAPTETAVDGSGDDSAAQAVAEEHADSTDPSAPPSTDEAATDPSAPHVDPCGAEYLDSHVVALDEEGIWVSVDVLLRIRSDEPPACWSPTLSDGDEGTAALADPGPLLERIGVPAGIVAPEFQLFGDDDLLGRIFRGSGMQEFAFVDADGNPNSVVFRVEYPEDDAPPED